MAVLSTEVLFLQVIDDCIAGKTSKEQALIELKKKYDASIIDIEKELQEHFKYFAFHEYIKLDIDEYIKICDKIENSQSAQEREDYEKIIQIIIDRVKADCDYYGHGQQGNSDITAILNVRNEVDKIRALCRKNRERTELFEKCKAEIKTQKAETADATGNEKIQITESNDQHLQSLELTIENTIQEQNPELSKESVTPQPISEYIEREKMLPLIQKMYYDKVITGEKIDGRWVIQKYKKGIKELHKWTTKEKMPPFSNNYIINTFCKPDGQPYSDKSVNIVL